MMRRGNNYLPVAVESVDNPVIDKNTENYYHI